MNFTISDQKDIVNKNLVFSGLRINSRSESLSFGDLFLSDEKDMKIGFNLRLKNEKENNLNFNINKLYSFETKSILFENSRLILPEPLSLSLDYQFKKNILFKTFISIDKNEDFSSYSNSINFREDKYNISLNHHLIKNISIFSLKSSNQEKKKINSLEFSAKFNLSIKWSADNSIELPSTSHISIVDQYGNALSMTTTIENGFGSRLMTDSGFLLNNELTDFSFKSFKNGKKVANSIEPSKRPRSSMAPTIILKNNKPVYILGSPGGSNIIGYVVNAIISMIDWKKNAQEAASVAHGINKFGTYYLEKNTIMSKLLPSLEDMKYKVKLRNFSSGLNIIHINNKLYGGSDHRREGIAIGD